ncbi:MAG: hypothetical protein N3H31_07150 [Candidatus Nezhaarchaeota archaeon]|nr:hypothetical protein [Candidatus Nezhaarchaeota archaeon]
MTRTKNEADIYAREARKLREVGVELSIAIFRNKQEMCIKAKGDERLAELSYHDFLRFCAELKKRAAGRSCEFYEAAVQGGGGPRAGRWR